MLPRLDGLEVCRAIRRTSTVPDRDAHRPRRHDRRRRRSRGRRRRLRPQAVRGARAGRPRPGRAAPRRPRVRTTTNGSGSARSRSTSPAAPSPATARRRAHPDRFDLLVELVRHAGQVLSRDVLLDRIWGYDYLGRFAARGRRDPAAAGQGRARPRGARADPHGPRRRLQGRALTRCRRMRGVRARLTFTLVALVALTAGCSGVGRTSSSTPPPPAGPRRRRRTGRVRPDRPRPGRRSAGRPHADDIADSLLAETFRAHGVETIVDLAGGRRPSRRATGGRLERGGRPASETQSPRPACLRLDRRSVASRRLVIGGRASRTARTSTSCAT